MRHDRIQWLALLAVCVVAAWIVGPPLRLVVWKPVDGGDRASAHPASGGDAGDARLTVDEHRAAAALPLRAAPVLRAPSAQLVAQGSEQRTAVVAHLDRRPVDDEGDRPRWRDRAGLLHGRHPTARRSQHGT